MGQYRTHVFVCSQAADLKEIVESHIVGGKPVERLRYQPGVKGANKKKDAK